MSDLLLYPVIAIFFYFIELVYFRLATVFGIIDRPNYRSSHNQLTIRGGGIIFPLSVFLYSYVNSSSTYPFFIGGLLIISIVSFIDDIKPLSRAIRFMAHCLAVSLLFIETGNIEYGSIAVIILGIFIIGSINAYNFMDGINGITGLYSLVTIATLLYVDTYISFFISPELLIFVGISLLVFIFFNFRERAVCFAGDIGSVSISYIIFFGLIYGVNVTGNLLFFGFLTVYGLDAGTTILFRLLRKENIFQPHRSHFYQFLSNEKQWPHLSVAFIYAVIQLLVNIYIVNSLNNNINNGLGILAGIVLAGGVIFIILRILTEGSARLMGYKK